MRVQATTQGLPGFDALTTLVTVFVLHSYDWSNYSDSYALARASSNRVIQVTVFFVCVTDKTSPEISKNFPARKLAPTRISPPGCLKQFSAPDESQSYPVFRSAPLGDNRAERVGGKF